MKKAQHKALLAHRQKLKRSGVQRVEVNVRKADVALVRRIAKALASVEYGVETRTWLGTRFGKGTAKGFKALLTSVSLEGVDLRRSSDTGRDVEL